MQHGITTSIRLPQPLRGQLESAAHALHQGKNWIITRALEEYLKNMEQKMREEERRQLLLAKQKNSENNNILDKNLVVNNVRRMRGFLKGINTTVHRDKDRL